MPYLAITRAGIASYTRTADRTAALWLGSGVLSDAEVRSLRNSGFSVSVFMHPVRTRDEIEDALPTLREHHPDEAVWIEAPAAVSTSPSNDINHAFLVQEHIVGVVHQHNEPVEVVSGPYAGARGSLVSLVCLEPEPTFVLESDSGTDIQVQQSHLGRLADVQPLA